ncbi:MAG TPA: arylsulfatase [Acidimicrobiales bacterium]
MSTSGEPQFAGRIGRLVEDSEPWWPDAPRPPAFPTGTRAPNVVVVLLDDTGFAHFGCYGSTIETPTIDRLAAGGLRYTNFHTTALCSPTRACLLTGRNHHTVGMRGISNWDPGFPHMRGAITPHAATLGEVLGDHGYATFALGKWHLAPMIECSAAGPHDNWPLQKGFDRFYGFLNGETDQFHPELTYDNHPIDPPGDPATGYHVSEDLVDHAIEFVSDLRSARPDRPFFTYLAFGATHAPHQAPPEYLAKYRGRFDGGWDVARAEWFGRQQAMGIVPEGTELAPRNFGVQAWDDLSDNQRLFACRLQEAFAAFLDHTDAQIGRFVDYLEASGELDNTVFVVFSDNGASQEGGAEGVMNEFQWFNGFPEDVDHVVAERLDDIGGPHSHTNYPWGWAQAGNTPLKWYKQNTFGGGVRDPLVVHWPDGIADRGGVRHQFCHVVDLAPTFFEVLGIEPPDERRGVDQLPVAGTSLAYTWAEPEALTRKTVQYFEQMGHRGIWQDGWKAVTYHWKGTPFADDTWELYHLDEDFSESRNLAETHPEKLAGLIDLWWAEAEAHGVPPLDDRTIELFASEPRPGTPHATTTYVYRPPVAHLPSDVSPRLGGRPYTITAYIERASADEGGVIVAMGSHAAGYSFFVKDGRLGFDYNDFGHHTVLTADRDVPLGRLPVAVRFTREEEGAGTFTLLVDDVVVASSPIPRRVRIFGSMGLDVGRDGLSPVSEQYEGAFPFTGALHEVRYDIISRRSEAADAAVEERAGFGTQ